MSLRVFAWDSNPNVDRHLYPQSNRRAAEIVASGRGTYIQLPDGRTAIKLNARPGERNTRTSDFRGNLIPYGRSYNPMMEPPSLNYPIPYAGDCRSICLRRFNLRVAKSNSGPTGIIIHRTIKVSTRKLDLSRPNRTSASRQSA